MLSEAKRERPGVWDGARKNTTCWLKAHNADRRVLRCLTLILLLSPICSWWPTFVTLQLCLSRGQGVRKRKKKAFDPSCRLPRDDNPAGGALRIERFPKSQPGHAKIPSRNEKPGLNYRGITVSTIISQSILAYKIPAQDSQKLVNCLLFGDFLI